MLKRRQVRAGRCLLAGIALAAAGAAIAQGTYPSRPITLVVGFAPGGGTDIGARIVAKQLSANLGQQVLVETAPAPVATSRPRWWRGRTPTGTRSCWRGPAP